MFKKKWQKNTFMRGEILLLCILVWVGSRTQDRTSTPSLKSYGGPLPANVQLQFGMMNDDLKYIKRIVHAQSDRILFIDQHDRTVEYRYAYQALWCNQTPIVFDVRAFHFEYRNQSGTLLTQTKKVLNSIEIVGYTVHILSEKKDILSSGKVALSSLNKDNQLLSGNQMALAFP